MALKPEEMGALDAIAELFPYDQKAGRGRYYPRPDHPVGGRPKHCIPIDERIDKLRKNAKQGTTPCLRAQNELAATPIMHIPHYHARIAIAASVENAQHKTIVEQTHRDDLQYYKYLYEISNNFRYISTKYYEKIESEADAARSALTIIMFNPTVGCNFPFEISHAMRAIEELQHASEKLMKFATQHVEGIKLTSKCKRSWDDAFCEHIGYLWRELTGIDPRPSSSEFEEFVSAAYQSLGGDRKEWETPITRAIGNVKMRGSSHGFDKYETGEISAGASWQGYSLNPTINITHICNTSTHINRLYEFISWPTATQRMLETLKDSTEVYFKAFNSGSILAEWSLSTIYRSQNNLGKDILNKLGWNQDAWTEKQKCFKYITYLGYVSAVDLSEPCSRIVGRVGDISEELIFYVDHPHELAQAFRKTIDDYLETCRKAGRRPEPPNVMLLAAN